MRVKLPDFSNYEIDKHGNIFSVARVVMKSDGVLQSIHAKQRKLSEHGTGYLTVRLVADDGSIKTLRHHILVAKTFIPNPSNLPFVNHKDGNKQNNSIANLEWVTAKENTAHGIATGLINNKGVNNPACRFTSDDVHVWIKLKDSGMRIKDIAKQYNCDRNTITRLISIVSAN